MRKRVLNAFAMLAMAFVFFYACRKSGQEDTGKKTPTEFVSIDQARDWYEQKVAQDGLHATTNTRQGAAVPYPGAAMWDYGRQIDFGNGTSILKVNLEGSPIPAVGYRDLLFQKSPNGTLRSVIIQVMPDSGYLNKRLGKDPGVYGIRHYISNDDFTGDILLFTLSGRFIKGRRYKDGSLTFELAPASTSSLSVSGNGRASVTPFSTLLTADEGEWGTPVYHDPITVTSPPSNPPPTAVWIFPPDGYNPANPGTGYPVGNGGAGGTPASDPAYPPINNPYSTQDICTQSFKFTKVIDLDQFGKGGYQIAAVTNVHMNLVDFTTKKGYILSPGPTLYFGLPIVTSSGKFINKDEAARLAADAVSRAEKDVMAKYHEQGNTLDVLGMDNYFKQQISNYMEKKGGSAKLEPGLNITGVPETKATYSGILGWGCN